MRAIFDDRQQRHAPKNFLIRGNRAESPEQPERADELKKGAEAAGYKISAPTDHGIAPIASVHSAEYLRFLQTIHERWQQLPGAADEVIPNIHPDRRTASYPRSPVGQAGYHQADTACPIGAGTWEGAYWSAQSALTAADLTLAGEANAYALCRPPGHHAYRDMAGGFCFLNNTAIAAQHLLAAGRRPAILDVDVHHGNGTQGIFYARGDVLTVSIHADPADYYPFFWGYAHERGEGEGLGANLNLPLPVGTGTDGFLEALYVAGDRIAAFGADILVVALGLDAHEGDPLQGMTVSTEGFSRIAGTIAGFGLPLLLIQEGGYPSPHLGANLTHFSKGL